MSSSRYWSHNSFEKLMNRFIPSIKPKWMTHLKIIPVEYSEWSDMIYVIVELDFIREAEEDLKAVNNHTRDELLKRTSDYLRNYCSSYFDMNIGVKEFRRREDYSYT